MAGAPKPFTNAFQNLPAGSFRYNTSQAGQVLPIVYGTQRTSVNLLEYWGFKGGSGGKGKGSSGKKGAQGPFSVNVAMAICQGPLPLAFTGARAGNNDVWANGGITGFSQTGLAAFAGNDGQAPHPVFSSNDPNIPVAGYSGIVYVAGAPMQLGQSPALPNIGFEIFGFLAGTVGPSYPNDANPSLIIEDLLTNSRYGAGFPSVNLDIGGSLADYATYCQAAQLAMSLLMDRPQAVARWIDEVCQLTVAAPVWSGALLKIIPYATGGFGGNGASWTPNLASQYTVTDDDLIPWGGRGGNASDPISVERKDWAALSNWLSLEYYDSANSYNPNIAPAFDQSAIDANGLRMEPSIAAHEFTNKGSASISAQLLLNRKQSVRQTYKFQLGWRFALVEPMDIITLNDPTNGIVNLPVRVTSITESDNGELQIEAEDLPSASSSAPPPYNIQNTAGAPPGFFVTPPNTNAPIIFDLPPALTGGVDEIVIVASGPNANWGGCGVWISLDGTNYQPIGNILAGAAQGVLSAGLANYTGGNPDMVDTLSIDLSESLSIIGAASPDLAAAFGTLSIVGNELLSFGTATLTAANKYLLGTLYRGAYGTPVTSHAAGENSAVIGLTPSPANLIYPYPPNLVGTTIYVKLPAYNVFGQEMQDLASATPYLYTLTGGGTSAGTNPVLAALAAGTSEDWGLVGDTVIASADLAPVTLPTSLVINVGTLP